MAIKRITSKLNKASHQCLNCNAKLGRIRDGSATKCPKCGTVHLIKFTDNGNIVMVDKKYKDYFEGGKRDGKRKDTKKH